MSALAINPWQPQPYRIRRVHAETVDMFTWELEAESGPVPSYRPGQFNMLYLFAHGEVAISLSGDPVHDGQHGRMTHTIRAVGSVTRAMQALKPDDCIGIRGPFGRGWPIETARGSDLLIIAGGLGLAPLRSLIEWVIHHRYDYGHVHILYGARSPQELLFQEDLKRWDLNHNVNVMVTVDNADTDWRGHIGTVTDLIPLTRLQPDTTMAFLCGPEVMMRFTLMALQQHALPSEAIHLSLERHMQCAVGYCGHCLYGPHFVCRDGPVFRHDQIAAQLAVREL